MDLAKIMMVFYKLPGLGKSLWFSKEETDLAKVTAEGIFPGALDSCLCPLFNTFMLAVILLY